MKQVRFKKNYHKYHKNMIVNVYQKSTPSIYHYGGRPNIYYKIGVEKPEGPLYRVDLFEDYNKLKI
jgi:hypothetical protein